MNRASTVTPMKDLLNLSISRLRAAYLDGSLSPAQLMADIRAAMPEGDPDHVWIHVLSEAELQPYLARLASADPRQLPLYGVPFAIKDNIDLAGVPTTAACAEYRYVPERSAFVVQRLIDAGAIPLGKTNLDQFATGLVGSRTPYGATRNSFNPAYISGGSSGGSAVAVAKGLVSFSLGTDTAGSGRVPAAFNNLVGIKPTRGLLSAGGVVPACRSLDTVSIFALDMVDAQAVLSVAGVYDQTDPYARPGRPGPAARASFRFGVPRQLEFFGDAEGERLFRESVARLKALGGEPVAIDFEPFEAAARLLYEGPWVAERYAAIQPFIESHADALFPVTRQIIEPGIQATAVAAFQSQYRLAEYKRVCDGLLDGLDFVLTPTAGTIYTLAQVEAEPIRLNSNLGRYTNFMNLLDYAAVAVPAGFGDNGLPYGVTLFDAAFADAALAHYGDRLQRALGLPLGGTGHALPDAPLLADTPPSEASMRLVVCGAHLSGLPLNHQLTERGGRLVCATESAPAYRLYALPGGPPKRPGMMRVEQGGAAIAVEVWELPQQHVGSFLAGIPAPLGLGRVELADGSWETGFICEGFATAGAEDITALGGWRAYLAR
jgi:allophanate hydrolase